MRMASGEYNSLVISEKDLAYSFYLQFAENEV